MASCNFSCTVKVAACCLIAVKISTDTSCAHLVRLGHVEPELLYTVGQVGITKALAEIVRCRAWTMPEEQDIARVSSECIIDAENVRTGEAEDMRDFL